MYTLGGMRGVHLWVTYPALAWLAGWAADLAGARRLVPGYGEGAFMGAALAFAVAMSPRPWIGALIAPALAAGAVTLSLIVQQPRPIPFISALTVVTVDLERGSALLVLAAGLAYAQLRRLERKDFSWRGPAFHLGIGLIAWLVACARPGAGDEAWLRFALTMSAGLCLAAEAILRLRRPPPPPASL